MTESRSFAPFENWKLFLGLSRTPHGLLDMATPAMAALLYLGHFPPTSTILIGLITAFAGYTAVYALNDLVDYRIDKTVLQVYGREDELFRVDGIMVRHPIAKGLLPYKFAFLWFAFWAVIALVGAWLLNPVCAGIFIVSASMEALYCKLLKITYLKIIPSAVVKASGGLAGVYAVDPNPSAAFVAMIFLWLSAWEIGGQNIVNDIVDMNADAAVSARTTLTEKGLSDSVFVLISALSMAVFCGTAIFWVAGSGIGLLYPVGAVFIGGRLLIEAKKIYSDPGPVSAASLFNKASYMPLGFLILTVLSILVPL